MAGEEFLTAVERFGELRFDGVHGDAELFGDFAVGKVFKFAEDEDFAATRRKLGDRRREQVGFLLTAGGLGGVGCGVEDARGDEFRYRNRVGGGARRKRSRAALRAVAKRSPRAWTMGPRS